MRHISLGGIVYLVIGFIIASNRGYLGVLGSLSHFISAALGVMLWPLLLFGVNLHITI